MPKTIKQAFSIIQQRIKILMLKNKIKKMQSFSYLDLYERMELRDAINLLQNLQQQQEFHNRPLLSLQ
jgi:hypothetical protein